MKDLTCNVKSYGAKGDGSTNDTPAIQSAIDACAAGNGGIVWFPAGRYKTTVSLFVRTESIVLEGVGYASVITPQGSFDTVVFQSEPPGTFLYGNRMFNLYFDETGKTGGRTIYADRVAEFAAQRVTATSGYNGIEFSVYNSIVLADVRLTVLRAALRRAIEPTLPGFAIAGKDVSITSMRFDTNCQLGSDGPYPGILVGGTSNGVVVTGCRSGSIGAPITQLTVSRLTSVPTTSASWAMSSLTTGSAHTSSA